MLVEGDAMVEAALEGQSASGGLYRWSVVGWWTERSRTYHDGVVHIAVAGKADALLEIPVLAAFAMGTWDESAGAGDSSLATGGSR